MSADFSKAVNVMTLRAGCSKAVKFYVISPSDPLDHPHTTFTDLLKPMTSLAHFQMIQGRLYQEIRQRRKIRRPVFQQQRPRCHPERRHPPQARRLRLEHQW